MNVKMKFIAKATAAVFGSALLLSAGLASAQISSVDALLQEIRNNSAKVEQENRERLQRFQQQANSQTGELRRAQDELAQLERRAQEVERSFALSLIHI